MWATHPGASTTGGSISRPRASRGGGHRGEVTTAPTAAALTGRGLVGVVAVLALVVAALAAQPALADGPEGAAGAVGSFEVDGNRADDSGPGEPIDWDTPDMPPNRVHFDDQAKSQTDNSFGQGSKELEPGGWTCTQGGVPGKSDLVQGDLALRTVDGKQFLYADWERLATNGDAHIDYELNQSSEPNPNCAGDPNPPPERTDKDLLFTFDTEQGGKQLIVRAFEWQFTGPGEGVFNELDLGTKHVTWDAAVNIPPEQSPPGVGPGGYGELAVNLTETIGALPCGPDNALHAYMKTRASTAIGSALKDRTNPHTFQVPCDFSVDKSSNVDSAQVGDTVDYSVTVTNEGDGPGSTDVVDDYDQDKVDVFNISNGGVDDGDTITWSDVSLEPGESVTLTYQAEITGPFSSGDAQGECAEGQFAVVNTATVDGDSDEHTVCVTAAPDLVLAKSASDEPVPEGGLATFTLSYENTGDGPATGVVITDTLPEGTAFESCSDACSVSGDQVTWDIGTVEPGESGEVTLTVTIVSVPNACVTCNGASIAGNEVDANPDDNDAEACVDVTPVANPDGANANGSAFGAHVSETGIFGVNETFVPVNSSQSGVGSDSANDELLGVTVPDDGSTLDAGVLRTTSTSVITEEPARANNMSTATAAEVDLLDGLITADVVRGVASATATGSSANFSSEGSTFENLVVDGEQIDDVAPNTRVELDALPGDSHVVLYEVVGSTETPGDSQLSGGTYAADAEVTMIRLHVDGGTLGTDTTVIVSNAVAHADFPQTELCEADPIQAVSGHAFNLSALTDPSLVPTTVGFVSIPSTGGSESQQLVEADAAGAATVATSASESTGTLGETSSTASSFAETQQVCVLPEGDTCLVSADVARSQSNSVADAGGASANDTGTELAGLEVAGVAISETPDPNTTIEIPGVGFVILNEQFCDNQGTLANDCADGTVAGHAGLGVRAIRLVVTAEVAGGPPPGAEIIVSEAHSDARWTSAP